MADGSTLSGPTAPTSVHHHLEYWLINHLTEDVRLMLKGEEGTP